MRHYLLDAELADGVVHQNHCVFDGHADVPVCPAALVRPVLGTLTLKHNIEHSHTVTQGNNSLNLFQLWEKKARIQIRLPKPTIMGICCLYD